MALLPLLPRPEAVAIQQKVKLGIANPRADTAALDLKESLRVLGLKQKQFAAQIDVTPETVTRWVRGHAPVPKLVTLYLALRLAR